MNYYSNGTNLIDPSRLKQKRRASCKAMIMMNEGTDYNKLLQSVFEMCDVDGNGFLTRSEFKNLCEHLCLEEEEFLLQKVLFQSNSAKLGYEKFRKVLLLLLAGQLTENCVGAIEQEFPSDDSLDQIEEQSLVTSTPKKMICNDNVINVNSYSERFSDKLNKAVQPKDSDFETVKNWSVIDLNEETEYEEKRSEKVNNENKNLEENQDTWSRKTNQKIIEPINWENEIIFEEFTGEGDGGDWINPENKTSSACPTSDHFNEANHTEQISTGRQAKDELACKWSQIIGDFHEKINVNGLQELFRVQGLTTAQQEVEKLFEILDDDRDGLITFNDFTREMSVYMQMNEEDQDFATPCSNPTSIHNVTKVENLSKSENENSHSYRTNNSFEKYTINNQNNLVSNITPSQSNSANEAEPRFSTSFSMKTNTANFVIGSSKKAEEEEEEDPMKFYHGVPPYRKGRRSNRTSIRHRRKSKISSLPHYHPIKQQSLEDCPLHFLTEEQERYVSSDKLKNIIAEEGVDNLDFVLEELGMKLDDSFSVEALSESFDAELKENPVHHAACSVYKNGLKYYKSQRDKEALEKRKLESIVKHLDDQVLEQEERFEKMEKEFKEQLESVESRYKNKLSRMKMKMETERDNIEGRNCDELNQTKLKLQKLQKAENKLKEELNQRELQKIQAEQRCKALEEELCSTKKNLLTMKTDFDTIFEETVALNQAHHENRTKAEKMMLEYQEESKKLQDRNEALLDHLNQITRKWQQNPDFFKEKSNLSESKSTLSFFETISTSALSLSNGSSTKNESPKRFINTFSITPNFSVSRNTVAASVPVGTESSIRSPASIFIRSKSTVSASAFDISAKADDSSKESA